MNGSFIRTVSMIATIGFACAFNVVGCKEGDSGAGKGAPSADSVGTGDPEALKALQAEIDKHWLKTPDGWFSQYPALKNIGGERIGTDDAFRQVKDFKFEIETGPLSEADKLNKFEFTGQSTTELTQRTFGFHLTRNDVVNFWTPWKSETVIVQVNKNNGRWVMETGMDDWLFSGTKPNADAIPKDK